MTILTIIVPCYNEEAVLLETSKRLLLMLNQLQCQEKVSPKSHICFVDDGSSDHTWALIEEQAAFDSRICGIKLSRNRGHQNALLAGLLTVEGDVVISIDADLQDDISVIEKMIDAYHDGKDVVYGVRKKRESDKIFKRSSAEIYYKLLKWMGVDVEFNHADFRLMSRRALNALKAYKEVNLFLRGIIPMIGLPSSTVTYERSERFAGESKYPLRKMIALSIDGITSFSALPLRMVAGLGIIIFLLSLVISIWVLWVRFVSGDSVPGWASSVLPMYFLGGIQLFCIGIVGEYVAKIYMETKQRPHFFIEKTT
jgi:glycosyltransferase involved in cell wall biosynthesis